MASRLLRLMEGAERVGSLILRHNSLRSPAPLRGLEGTDSGLAILVQHEDRVHGLIYDLQRGRIDLSDPCFVSESFPSVGTVHPASLTCVLEVFPRSTLLSIEPEQLKQWTGAFAESYLHLHYRGYEILAGFNLPAKRQRAQKRLQSAEIIGVPTPFTVHTSGLLTQKYYFSLWSLLEDCQRLSTKSDDRPASPLVWLKQRLDQQLSSPSRPAWGLGLLTIGYVLYDRDLAQFKHRLAIGDLPSEQEVREQMIPRAAAVLVQKSKQGRELSKRETAEIAYIFGALPITPSRLDDLALDSITHRLGAAFQARKR